MEEQLLDSKTLKRTKAYLQHALENTKRLKNGKKIKRKWKYRLLSNKYIILSAFFVLTIIFIANVTYIRLHSTPEPTPQPKPNDKLTETLEFLTTNFTNSEGYILDPKNNLPTSRTISLTSLLYSMLLQGQYLERTSENYAKVRQILDILHNNSFYYFLDPNTQLPVSEQWQTCYSLIQAYYTLRYTEAPIAISIVRNTLSQLLYTTYNFSLGLFLDNSTTATLKTQVFAAWSIATYCLLTMEYNIEGLNLIYILKELTNNLFFYYYLYPNDVCCYIYNTINDTGIGVGDSYDRTLLVLALSRIERLNIDINAPVSSYYIHQRITNTYIDDDWIIHKAEHNDIEQITIQALFTLTSFLMNLNTVAEESLNVILKYYAVFKRGFLTNVGGRYVSSISCIYGAIAIASKRWGYQQRAAEHPYFAGTEAVGALNLLSLLSGLTLSTLVVRQKLMKKRKRRLIY